MVSTGDGGGGGVYNVGLVEPIKRMTSMQVLTDRYHKVHTTHNNNHKCRTIATTYQTAEYR